MANLQEVPTEELLSFQDYPVVHQNATVENNSDQAQINVTISNDDFRINNVEDPLERESEASQNKLYSIWSIEYYQKFFNVDTKDVTDRLIASITPLPNYSLRHHMLEKPDLYGPFWISMTLIFTIAISGNISNYLQHDENRHWRYDFKLVSYAATVIWIYVMLIPISLWAFLKWTVESPFNDEISSKTPSLLQLICIYGYSLFIYIPVSILWSIQILYLQWLLGLSSAALSGSVLMLTLLPSLRASKHNLFLILSVISCHLLLATGLMLYFFQAHENKVVQQNITQNVTAVVSEVVTEIIKKTQTVKGNR